MFRARSGSAGDAAAIPYAMLDDDRVLVHQIERRHRPAHAADMQRVGLVAEYVDELWQLAYGRTWSVA